MTDDAHNNPILKRFRAALNETYGERIERVVRSARARADAHEDSDYDIAVFLHDYAPGTSTELYRLADLSTAFSTTPAHFFTRCPIRPASTTTRACR